MLSHGVCCRLTLQSTKHIAVIEFIYMFEAHGAIDWHLPDVASDDGGRKLFMTLINFFAVLYTCFKQVFPQELFIHKFHL